MNGGSSGQALHACSETSISQDAKDLGKEYFISFLWHRCDFSSFIMLLGKAYCVTYAFELR